MIGDRADRNMHKQVLETAHEIATKYLDEVASRHVGGNATPGSLKAALGGPLPRAGASHHLGIPRHPPICPDSIIEGATPWSW